MPEATACGVVRPLLAELATGAVTGQARAEALAHVAACASCRQELAALSRAMDEILLLAPAIEPPASVESAVMTRLRTRPAPGRASVVASRAAVARDRPGARRGSRRGAGPGDRHRERCGGVVAHHR